MSALQQSPICGLEEPEFPYRGEACQGHRAAGQSRRSGRRYTVAVRAEDQGFRSSPTVATKIRIRE
jgi:hypothetical protein